MSKLRRYHENGYIYFITNVTYAREPLLVANIDIPQNALEACNSRCPYELPAWVVLPDHFHLVLDPGSAHISVVLQRIKLSFAAQYRKRHGLVSRRVWQHRFWDHVIRSQEDMNRHIDYIHFNPVKHGLVNRPQDWSHSSFGEYLRQGWYLPEWGMVEPVVTGEFGE